MPSKRAIAAVVVIADRTIKVSQGLNALGSKRVMVGVPAEKTLRTDDQDSPTGKTVTNAEIGFWNEHGAPEANLPARPHLIPGVRGVQKESIKMMGQAMKFAMEGNPGKVDQQLHKLGLLNQNAVRAKVLNGPFAPLAESTLAARKRRGRTGTKPLLDTGQYLRSITYVIRQR